jgi:hypothetical protein
LEKLDLAIIERGKWRKGIRMPIFMIETYKVSSYLERFKGETRPSHVLELTGPVLHHGIRNRALFAFDPQFDGV